MLQLDVPPSGKHQLYSALLLSHHTSRQPSDVQLTAACSSHVKAPQAHCIALCTVTAGPYIGQGIPNCQRHGARCLLLGPQQP